MTRDRLTQGADLCHFVVGDAMSILRTLPDGYADCVITSPPYLQLRSYLPADHPDKAKEIGSENSPGAFLESLLMLTDELWRVLKPEGTIWINLGDTASGSGGAGGDYGPGGLRDGQEKFAGSAKKARAAGGWPRPKSVCWVPQLFGASLAYGQNLLTGTTHCQWITRPPVTWCKPNPPVGEIIDKFRPATELIVLAAKQPRYYFDLDGVRIRTGREGLPSSGTFRRTSYPGGGGDAGEARKTSPDHPLGAPPLDWWVVPTLPFKGAHYATFPPDLITKPIVCGCPPGGIVLDPFAGSGTTLAVAQGHGRGSFGIDIDPRNADLARLRVGMWLTIETTEGAVA